MILKYMCFLEAAFYRRDRHKDSKIHVLCLSGIRTSAIWLCRHDFWLDGFRINDRAARNMFKTGQK